MTVIGLSTISYHVCASNDAQCLRAFLWACFRKPTGRFRESADAENISAGSRSFSNILPGALMRRSYFGDHRSFPALFPNLVVPLFHPPPTRRSHFRRQPVQPPRKMQAITRPTFKSTHSLSQVRFVSSSPYGRTHVWKHRPKKLPNPTVPQFPQMVVRADGSTFTHYTTSPRYVMRLTRDTTNHPMWQPFVGNKEDAAAEQLAGRLGRFNKRFDGLGGLGTEVDWMSTGDESEKPKAKDS